EQEQERVAEAHRPPAHTALTWSTARTRATGPPTCASTETCVPEIASVVRTAAINAAVGGRSVKKPTACDPPRRRSPLAHVCVMGDAPGCRSVVLTRRVVGCPGVKTGDEAVGRRPPPPDAGMQPMCGRTLAAAGPAPVYTAVKTALRWVVMPGLTGLPRAPEN